ncbi:MAG: hypothetical protein JWP97_298 [Labilithrix sp.]|nr:hypothetical protein [Labilithrix sp.]
MGALGGIPLDVGDVLAKKYRLERLIGEGGTGIVVAARHVQLDRPVAIKFLRAALASDEVRARFEREARAIEQIESAHVVSVLEFGWLDDLSPYMVMEALEGRDLARILKEDGPLGIEDAVDCMLQVCEALVQAHARGIVHRDLKPANLFLTRREDGAPHIKVVDFGISKILDPKVLGTDERDMTGAFTVLGSPRYMAPEQLRNSKDVDARADLWSIGAVMFQIISGRAAFDAENNVHASLAVLTTEAPLLRELVPSASKKLEGIVNRCLSKDREARFQSAAELADALRPLATKRTRDSLARLEEAKAEPSVSIGLAVPSVGDHAPSSGGSPSSMIPPPPSRASQAPSLTPPLFASDRPSRMPGHVVRPRSRLVTYALVGFAGLLVVALAFGLLTGLKLAAQSVGLMQAGSAAPGPSAAPSPDRIDRGPSQAITVTLDAGRPPAR